MERAKCGGRSQTQHCTALGRSGQTSGIQGQVENHSADGPTVAEEGEWELEEGNVADASNPEVNPSQQAKSLKRPGRRNMIKRPKSNDTTEWKSLDEHSSNVLQRTLHGPAEAKLNLYEECRSRYGELTFKKPAARTKGRKIEGD